MSYMRNALVRLGSSKRVGNSHIFRFATRRRYQTTYSQGGGSSRGRRGGLGFVLSLVGCVGVGYAFGVHGTGSFWRNEWKSSYASESKLQKAVRELETSLGEDSISTDPEELERHGYSEWSSTNTARYPNAIVYPNSTEDVTKIAQICNKYRVPVVPYSGGSSLEGNFAAPYGGVTIDFANMDKVIAVHPDDMDAIVQPAVPWMQFNEQIKQEGLFFPVDPGPTAEFGGMVGTGGSGTNAVRYGTMRDWVINLTVVLADGRVIKTRRRPRKSAAGYNLTQLFIGCEGTLGIVTEITIKLAPVPQETSVALAPFPTVHDAAAAAVKILRAGIPVAAMEVMDEEQMRVVNLSGATGKKWTEVPTIFFKFSGTRAGVKDNIAHVQDIAQQHNSSEFTFARNKEEQDRLWSARKEALWSFIATKSKSTEIFQGTDVAVPLSRLPDLIEESKSHLNASGLRGTCIGHIGDGNFHAGVLYDKENKTQCENVDKFVHELVDKALAMEGTCTGEHGVGIGKKKELIDELGIETVETMRLIKKILDPNWIMNPGKIVEAPGYT